MLLEIGELDRGAGRESATPLRLGGIVELDLRHQVGKLAHERSKVICFVSVSASTIQPASSRPAPDFFAPPNGAI